MSDKSMSSSCGSSPSLPSHASDLYTLGISAPLTGAVCPRPKERSLKIHRKISQTYRKTPFFYFHYNHLKNSLIPFSEKDPRNREYFIFLTLTTAMAGYPKPPISNASSICSWVPASAHTQLWTNLTFFKMHLKKITMIVFPIHTPTFSFCTSLPLPLKCWDMRFCKQHHNLKCAVRSKRCTTVFQSNPSQILHRRSMWKHMYSKYIQNYIYYKKKVQTWISSGAGMFSDSFSKAQLTISLVVRPPLYSLTESESFLPDANILIVGYPWTPYWLALREFTVASKAPNFTWRMQNVCVEEWWVRFENIFGSNLLFLSVRWRLWPNEAPGFCNVRTKARRIQWATNRRFPWPACRSWSQSILRRRSNPTKINNWYYYDEDEVELENYQNDEP